MSKKYFDADEFNIITKYSETQPISTIVKIKEYLDKYPKDLYAVQYLASLYIMIGNIEDAKSLIQLTDTYLSTSLLDNREDNYRISIINRMKVLNEIKIAVIESKWKEAIKLYNYYYGININNDGQSIYRSAQNVRTLAFYNLGYPKKNSSYFSEVTYNYNKNLILDHVTKKFIGHDEESDSYFYQNIDIDKLYDEIRRLLPNSKGYFNFLANEKHIFKYDLCGYSKKTICNYVEAVVIYGTDKLLTMYPIKSPGELEVIDINYLNDNLDISKNTCKKLSRIDKFNNKYNRR